MFRGIVVAAQSPQWLSRCADAQQFLKELSYHKRDK